MTIRPPLGSTMTVLEPAPGVLAFYDGRVAGVRAFADGPNWVDDGAFELGIASYAVVDGSDALVYDTHISIPHARLIRGTLESMGVTRMTVVLSHWHLDHIAGNEVFADCEIIAHMACAEEMGRRRAKIETGTEDGAPPIAPLVMPTRTFEDVLALKIGRRDVLLRHADIHSRDEALIVLPDLGLMLAGDALEDTVTFVAEPDGLERHLADLARIATWKVSSILPNHGDPDIIARGGYAPSLITATERYVTRLLRCPFDPALAEAGLRTFVADELAAGWITYFAPYESVHRDNVAAVLKRTVG
jgi:cyclase